MVFKNCVFCDNLIDHHTFEDEANCSDDKYLYGTLIANSKQQSIAALPGLNYFITFLRTVRIFVFSTATNSLQIGTVFRFFNF